MIKNGNNTNNKTNNILMDESDENIIKLRAIFSSVSSIFCLFLIIVYIILCFQKKLNLCSKKDNNNAPIELLDNERENNSKSSNSKRKNNNKNNNIGLGSNFMFLLTLSNFLGAIFEIFFYFYYIDKKDDFEKNYIKENPNEPYDDKKWNFIYKEFNDDNLCQILGFVHNFFDLFSICWITMLTLLFYHSINLSNEMQYKENKYLTIGFIFSFVSCIIFCGLPLITKSYGFGRYYCSFRYNEVDDKENNYNDAGEKNINKVWRYSFVGISLLNTFIDVILLIITNKFYSKKLKIIKKQNIEEYNIMIIYVWVFRIFPIVLTITRIFKGFSRIYNEHFDNEKVDDIIQNINAFFLLVMGYLIPSLAFFSSGVYYGVVVNLFLPQGIYLKKLNIQIWIL